MAEIVGSALRFSVLFDKLATEEVKNFLRPKKVINKLLEKLEVSLLSANQLLDVAEEKWLNELKDVVYKASELGDKIKTEALRRNLEGHQSASNITKMFTKLCSNLWNLCSNLLSSFDNDVEDELEEILSSLEHLLSQKDALGLVPPGTGRSNDSGVTPATQLEGHQSARNKTTKMFKFFSKNSFHNYVIDELEEILSSLERLLSRKDELGLKRRSNYSDVTPAVRFRATPVADESGFCGREDIKETIIRSAEVGGDKVSVIPVIGPGGIGKTTLAQIIYHHPDVEKHFPKEDRVWITVSTEFDLLAIAKRIIGKFSSSSQIHGDDDPQELLFNLRDALKGKRFLLVLDDVWSEDRDEWDNLKSCFQSGEPGSKIIVTTRSSRVASIAAPNQQHHFLPELPEEDCRRLFAKTVFTGDQDWDAHLDLQEIGKKIVEKCKGLPLSVKSVGGILRDNRDAVKWESILKSSVWELLQQNNKNIIPSLWLSYRYLPSEIKPCFAYCCIFPQDYRFEKEEVVRLWMAEGLLKNEAGKRGITMEEVGKRYFEELISRSLFQSSGDWYTRDCFIMHDLVHDLAMYVSGKFCFWMDEDKTLHDLGCETRHLSYDLAMRDAKKFEGLSKAKRLHTFVGFELSYESEEELDILKVLEEVSVEDACLRVLSLSSDYKIDSLLDSVGKLKHLRYLNLSYTTIRELPHSVDTLYNLQTLLLSSCKNLTRLPESIGNLKQLRYLDLSYSDVRELPDSIGTLYNLQTLLLLRCRSLTRLPSNQGSLIKLHHLDISDSPKLEFLGNCRYGSLKCLKIVKCEALKWIPLDYFPKLNELELKGLECLIELTGESSNEVKRLFIEKCPKLEFLGNCLYGSLKDLKIVKCEALKSIPLDYFPKLNTLDLKELECLVELTGESADELKWLSVEECPILEFTGNGCYRSLKDLKIKKCEALKSIILDYFPKLNTLDLKELECQVELTGESAEELKWLSVEECPKLEFTGNGRYRSLKDLKIKKCKALKSIPLDYFPKLNTLDLKELECLVELTGVSADELKWLSIQECPKLEFTRNCRYGSLEDLEIVKCEALKSIPLDYFPKLNTFDLKKCGNFESFTFAEEPHLVLKSLYLWDLPKFVSFPEGGLPIPNLKYFRILECENLRSLPQQMHRLLPSLNILQVRNCGEIEWWAEGGLPSNLESLRIWECKKLATQVMHWDLQTLTPCLRRFSIDGCGEELLDSFPPEGLLPTSLTSLWIRNFRGLKTLNIHAFQHLNTLIIENCDELQCLPEESLPNSLSYLSISDCSLLERRYRKETGEGWHKISHIPTVKISHIPTVKICHIPTLKIW